jgi:hypothetical protein
MEDGRLVLFADEPSVRGESLGGRSDADGDRTRLAMAR